MAYLSNKCIVLGVSGGIAAYKSAELVRLLRAQGAQVRVVMTTAATDFITPLTLQTLSGHPVWTQWSDEETSMGHIELARWADHILIAPATADVLARLAHGRADDVLAAMCLASEVPLSVAPAMNQAMWRNQATIYNVEALRERGVHILGPDSGEQACGETGPGRMQEPAALVDVLAQTFSGARLSGLRVMVTAGPTREPVDAVRYLSNRSSGKMGYAVAAAAREAGADVYLISGPVSNSVAQTLPHGVQLTSVESAQQMLEAVMREVQACDLFIAAAAVADFRPRDPAPGKLKKHGSALSASRSLALEPVTDILATVSALESRPFCAGFAAETSQLEHYAQKKRMAKGVELIAANLVGPELGFDRDDNELLLVWEGGKAVLSRASKVKLARQLIEKIADRYFETTSNITEHYAKHSAQDS